PVEQKIVEAGNVRERIAGIQPKGRLCSLNPPFILARAERGPARHNRKGLAIPRIGFHPRLESLQLPRQVSRYLPVVKKEDPESFAVADAAPQLIGFACVLGSQISLAHIPVREG